MKYRFKNINVYSLSGIVEVSRSSKISKVLYNKYTVAIYIIFAVAAELLAACG